MKFKFTYLLFFSSLALFIFYGNASGPGKVQKKDRTGSPLSPGPCQVCHSSGAFSPAISIKLIDGEQEVDNYEPEKQYTLHVEATADNNVSAFGFQLVALSGGDDNLNAGTFGTPKDGLQISEVGGRKYVEHSKPNNSGTFEIAWTAPPKGTGEVKLYSAIVAANLNGSTGGDGSVFANVTLSEAEVSRIFDSELNIDLQLFPNPVQEVLNINLSSQESGTANIKLINLSGQIVKQSAINLFYGQQSKSIALSNFPKGIYFLHFSNGEKSIVKKILKQ